MVEQGAETSIGQSMLWGLGAVIASEVPEQFGGLIDLDPDARQSELAIQLAGEIQENYTNERIAFRKGERYVARLEHAQTSVLKSTPPSWRANATYLVTGALGGLGLRVARWMVDQGARRLILLDRVEIPPRAQWLQVTSNTPAADAIGVVRELEALGAAVHYARVDVGDEGQLSGFLDGFAREAWPAIRGVVHAAGITQPRSIMELETREAESVLRPKVRGGWLLHHLLSDTPLDFFVLFSSVAAFLPSPLLGTYAAANAFLDALAHFRHSCGQAALSVDWGTWDDSQSANPSVGGREYACTGAGNLTTDQGLEALARLMRGQAIQAGVMPIQWPLWASTYPKEAQQPLVADLVRDESLRIENFGGSVGDELPRAAIVEADPPERARLIDENLRKMVSSVFRLPLERLDVNEPLSGLGMDSLMAFELKRRIEDCIGINLPAVTILRGPSVAQLGKEIAAQFNGKEQAQSSASASLDPCGAPVIPTQHSFSSHDGLIIYGHLSLPEGAGPFPAVVVHTADTGGALDAEGRYVHIYEHGPLIAAGFAVFTVDQRGSLGHGLDYVNRADLGGRDVDDLIAGTEYLMVRQEINRQRVFMLGTSRGAYAGLLAAQRVNLWRGIVLNMGFYDPVAHAQHESRTRHYDSPLRHFSRGAGWEPIFEYFRDPLRNPLANLRAVRAPMLALHGEDDQVVPIDQALELQQAASEAGATFSLERVAGMGHDIYYRSQEIWPSLWNRVVKFLKDCEG